MTHTDHLNTPRLATDNNGNIIWHWQSDAFGGSVPGTDATPNEDPDNDGTATIINLRFPGQYYDKESQLFYNHNRYYSPQLGRYITSDPIGLRGGLNTYGYAYQNPLAFVDVDGLDPHKWPDGNYSDNDGYAADWSRQINDAYAKVGEGIAKGWMYHPAVTVGLGGLGVLTGKGLQQGAKACTAVVKKNKDKIKKACQNSILATVLGIAICNGTPPRQYARDSQNAQKLAEGIPRLRRNTGVVPRKK